MALTNFTDISRDFASAGAGFQFEFKCADCGQTWRSPLQPYKRGRITGLLTAFDYIFNTARGVENLSRRVADFGVSKARQEALEQAQARAAAHFEVCEQCNRAFCGDCYHDNQQMCRGCTQHAAQGGNGQQGSTGGLGNGSGGSQSAGGATCPNCGTPGHNGRFCAECGFDMASTHKSCPQCGAMADRGARFCVDCGHGY